MSNKAITEKQEEQRMSEQRLPRVTVPVTETAPSVLREDEPTLARTLGLIGGALVIFGSMALFFNLSGRAVRVSTGWSVICVAIGLSGLLFHAAFDKDSQIRRIYMNFGLGILAIGIALCLIPYPKAIGDQFRWGIPCMGLAFVFLLAFLRNEDNIFLRELTQRVMLGVGTTMAVIGLFGGTIKGEFFLPIGFVLSLLGLVYLTGFVGTRGIGNDLAYYVALAIAGLGGFFILATLGRSFLSSEGSVYFVSYGLIILVVAVLYVLVGLGISLDWPVLVLTRRELGSFFFSPIAYLVMFGFAFFSWFSFVQFLDRVARPDEFGPAIEPIVQRLFLALFPVFTIVFVVPILTMRLLSEEQRTGTLEVLLTAPVGETEIVLAKFLASMVTYLFVWLPFGCYLLAIPLMGGNPFDYRPLLSFLVALIVTGAGFMSMGLFFSSLTKNQIASGVLTFTGMLALTFTYFASDSARDPAWRTVLNHMSYIDIWFSTLQGKIVPQMLLFYLSLTILCLFLTVKVLESRKWR